MKSMKLGAATALALIPMSVVHAGDQTVTEVSGDVRHDVSLPLRYLARLAPPERHTAPRVITVRPIPVPGESTVPAVDSVLQTVGGHRVGAPVGVSFAGVGQGDYGFSPSSAPPDTNAAVGLTQIVQEVNTSIGIFNKSTGALLVPVAATNTVWTGFGGGCETNNDGDGGVKYDRIADRWVITQFSVTTTPYLECIAVSQTSDATGAYYRYAFTYGTTQFPDYPKVAVWPDAYYATYNIFTGNTFTGAKACAFDRTKMLTGAAATQQCVQFSNAYGGVLPSDQDGATAPPAGSPNYLVNYGANSLNLWKFHVDWATPANTKLTGPTSIPVPAFSATCGGGTCVPQKGTRQKLDSLADRVMYRLSYRNFGGHESLVVNHSVKVGSTGSGIRWYELRSPGATPTLFQSGTYAPDSSYRWMGSIAMDKVGDIAVGYSVSSSTLNPAIRYTGRVPTDPAGTMEAEAAIKAGAGSQTGGLNRWGDYSSLAVDPSDDCTFVYSNEYLKANGSFNWSTWIASFKFPGCV